ncbi:unnamed protein product [Nesidiocoris tenuis]|uniref:CCHC-type domain-containing protein n=1 Tax=Nesidiocoris tenuis TaxID=355587 RepID=A0A6H5GVZ8_9HEMI|nr:unnamed protein product [Nesidiocoris tenuis]
MSKSSGSHPGYHGVRGSFLLNLWRTTKTSSFYEHREEGENFESAREMIIESDEKTSYFDYENVQYQLDIKLEQNGEVAFNLWYRTIIDAIESQDCAFLLTGEDMPESYNDNERDKRLAAKKLKLFLMSHLDLHYQGMVGNLSDPKEILSVLRKFCEQTSKAFVNNLMQKFARLDFESQVETPLEFINRFDDLVRKIRQINSDVMNEPYIKQTFMGAIRDTHTYQRELDNEAGFGLSQLKNMLIEEFNEIEQMSVLDKSLRTSTLLATGLNQHQMKGSTLRGRGRGVGVLRRGVQKNLGERSSAANEHFHAKTFRGGVNRKIVCYNCGRKGHPFKMCRSKLRVCYNCNQLTTHLAAQCTEPKRNPGLSYTPSSKAKMTANKKVPKVVKMKVGDAKLFQKHLMNTGKPATTFFIAGEADLKENENTWVLMGENEEISLLNFSRERLGQAAMNVSAGKHLTSFRAVIDTGATEHLANRREYFETLRVFETPKRFTCANKDLEADLVCKYYGDIAILNNGKVSRLKNVLYSPELAVNLFSLRKVTGAGMEVIFSKDKAKFVDSSTENVVYGDKIKDFPKPLAEMLEICTEEDSSESGFPDEKSKDASTDRLLYIEPNSFKEAMNCPERDLWEDSIRDELSSLESNGTWEFLPKSELPSGTKVIKARWVYKRKLEANGTHRYKSRLVARGFADANHYELNEIYAPVARLSDVRLVLSIANKYDLELNQLDDVSNWFLTPSVIGACMSVIEQVHLRSAMRHSLLNVAVNGACAGEMRDSYLRTHVSREKVDREYRGRYFHLLLTPQGS